MDLLVKLKDSLKDWSTPTPITDSIGAWRGGSISIRYLNFDLVDCVLSPHH